MTTYPHELTKCENCDSHYCMGCVGEDCPNCKLQEIGFYAISLENKIEAFTKLLAKGPSINVDTLEESQQAVDDWLGKLMNSLEDDA